MAEPIKIPFRVGLVGSNETTSIFCRLLSSRFNTHKTQHIIIRRLQHSLPGCTDSVYRQQPAERSCFDSAICRESLSAFAEPDIQQLAQKWNDLITDQCDCTVPCKQSVKCFSLVINHFSNPGRAICIACEFVFCKQNLDFDWPKYVALSIQSTRSLVKVLTYGVKIFVFGYIGSQFTDKCKYSKENHFNHKNWF